MTFPELDHIKDVQNHLFFEKWRGKTEAELVENEREFAADLMKSYLSYSEAWEKALNRAGLDATAAAASWTKVVAALESLTRRKLSLRSSAEKAPTRQEPSTRTKIWGKDSEKTITRPSNRSSVTKSGKRLDIETTPSEPNIEQGAKEVKNTEGLTCAEGGLSWPILELTGFQTLIILKLKTSKEVLAMSDKIKLSKQKSEDDQRKSKPDSRRSFHKKSQRSLRKAFNNLK